jgi:rhodanese-related sulfurtransferase
MRKLVLILVCSFVAFSLTGIAFAADNPLKANEKKVWQEEFVSQIPKDKLINVDQFYKVWEKAMKDKAYRDSIYLIDVRSHPEFYAFHIQGTDHIHAGHMYTIPKLIPDPNAEIYIWCRTAHRAQYVGGFLYKYGYKNVYVYKGGVVDWAKAGHEFVNQFTGKFKITEYYKQMTGDKDAYRIREFHPY